MSIMKKSIYQKPKTKVVKLYHQSALLSGSTEPPEPGVSRENRNNDWDE